MDPRSCRTRPSPSKNLDLSLGSGAARVHILKGISLDVDAGEAIGLVGPSGSGKSTLLMTMAGLERPDSGRITIAGQDLAGMDEDALARFRGRNIGIVFQSFHLVPTMTALENVALPLELADRPDAFARAEKELRAVGLGERLNHYPAQLSGGEQQRVAIARAIAPDPAIIVADEPTGNLDETTGGSIVDLLFAIKRDRGATLVLVTHDTALARSCDRMVRLRSGRIEEPDTPAGNTMADRGGGGLMHGTLSRPDDTPRGGRASRLPLVLRLALREMRSGLRGFGIFLGCIALGVAAIAGVSSLSSALTEGMAREGRTILGGDLAYSLLQREATPTERDLLASHGEISAIATLRGMAHADENGSALVEIKAVGPDYPVIGEIATTPQAPIGELLAERDGVFGAVADPVLLSRLDLETGDEIRIGTSRFEIRAALQSEPDKVAEGIGFGPRLLMTVPALRESGLIQPGSLVRWTYRIALPGGAGDDALLARVEEAIDEAAPEAGWRVRSRLNADPQFQRNIERFAQFLTLVGLTALIVGGVGVANAVRGFVDRKRDSIATLKGLGAPGGQVVGIYLTQVMTIAGLGILAGLAIGAAIPFAAAFLLRDVLPIPIAPVLAWSQLGIAALYGGLIALAFAILPLGRVHDIEVTHLFRDQIDRDRRWPRKRYIAVALAAAGALIALSLGAAYEPRVASIFIVAIAIAFVLLRLVAAGLMALARRLPRPRPRRPASGARQYPSPRRAHAVAGAVAGAWRDIARDDRPDRREHAPPADREPAAECAELLLRRYSLGGGRSLPGASCVTLRLTGRWSACR